MVEKYKLNLLVAFIILLIVVWLIGVRLVWDWVGMLLLLGVAVLIVRTLLLREKKQAKLLEFFLKSLIVSFVATAIIWFVWMGLASPSYYTLLNLDRLMNALIIYTLPLSLLPVAISVIIYGVFRTKLKVWEIFLSSWYVSLFTVFLIYSVWWSLYVHPYLPEFYYSPFASWMGSILGLVLLSFLIAGIIAVIYMVIEKSSSEQRIAP